MKTLITLIFILIPLICNAGGIMFIGGTTSATPSCTTANDGVIAEPTSQPGDNTSNQVYYALKITLSAQTLVTTYKVRQADPFTGTTATTMLYTHDSGNDKPNTEVASSSKQLALPDAETVNDYDLATPLLVDAGTYWIVNRKDAGMVLHYYKTADSNRGCYSADGSSWTCAANTAYDMELWGCQ